MRRYDDQPKRGDAEPQAKAIDGAARSGSGPRKLDELYRLIFSCVALLFLARLLVGAVSAMGADITVGDTVSISPGNVSNATLDISVPARLVDGPWAAPAQACTLDVATMAQPGGTMTVMAVRPDGVMLSWAGGQTASGAAACRKGEQILVSTADYQQLLVAQSLTPTSYPAK